MTKEIATLSFKLLSLYAFIKAIDNLSTLIYYCYKYRLGEVDIPALIIYAAPMLLLLLCGGLLWFIAPFLASSISKSTISEDNSAASLLDIQMVAFSVVGLYMLADFLPRVVRSTIWHFTSASLSMGKIPIIGRYHGFLSTNSFRSMATLRITLACKYY
jgi:hypothetical protein